SPAPPDAWTPAPLAISSQLRYCGAAAVACARGAAINAAASSPPNDVENIRSSFRGSPATQTATRSAGSGKAGAGENGPRTPLGSQDLSPSATGPFDVALPERPAAPSSRRGIAKTHVGGRLAARRQQASQSTILLPAGSFPRRDDRPLS